MVPLVNLLVAELLGSLRHLYTVDRGLKYLQRWGFLNKEKGISLSVVTFCFLLMRKHSLRLPIANCDRCMLCFQDEELDTDRSQRPFRRRTLSMSSRMSTASVSSMVRPLSTAPQSGQPSPTHPGLPSWPGPEIEVTHHA